MLNLLACGVWLIMFHLFSFPSTKNNEAITRDFSEKSDTLPARVVSCWPEGRRRDAFKIGPFTSDFLRLVHFTFRHQVT